MLTLLILSLLAGVESVTNLNASSLCSASNMSQECVAAKLLTAAPYNWFNMTPYDMCMFSMFGVITLRNDTLVYKQLGVDGLQREIGRAHVDSKYVDLSRRNEVTASAASNVILGVVNASSACRGADYSEMIEVMIEALEVEDIANYLADRGLEEEMLARLCGHNSQLFKECYGNTM